MSDIRPYKNIPFEKKQVEALDKGFTPSGWFPNRKARREHMQKIKPALHGLIERKQLIFLENGGKKWIFHFRKPLKKQQSI